MSWKDLTVKAINVKGFCPVYEVGDTFYLDQGYKLNCSKSCNVCVHALNSIMSFMVPLSAGLPLKDLGLGHEDDDIAYVQCLDPGPPYTEGGTVTFAITRSDAPQDE